MVDRQSKRTCFYSCCILGKPSGFRKKHAAANRSLWINGESIEGIFVANEMQSHGIGKLLLDFLKEKKTKLSLNVYQKNTRAIRFYQREGFQIQCEGLDEATGEKDYEMVWKRE